MQLSLYSDHFCFTNVIHVKDFYGIEHFVCSSYRRKDEKESNVEVNLTGYLHECQLNYRQDLKELLLLNILKEVTTASP